MFNDGHGNIGGPKRFVGIHNMTLEIPDYQPVHLIKNDVCFYPGLFTILNNFLANDNMLVQQCACVKLSNLPLFFGFQIQNDVLTVYSSISKYRFLAPFRAQEIIQLRKTSTFDIKRDLTVTVSINGRAVVVKPKTIVKAYSSSSYHPYAILARTLFL